MHRSSMHIFSKNQLVTRQTKKLASVVGTLGSRS